MKKDELPESSKSQGAVTIPADLRGCHLLISQTRKALEKEKPDEKSMLRSTQKGILDVTVSRGSLQRALLIMQAVVTAVEARGWSFKPQSKEPACAIKIGDDEIGVRISERVKRFDIPPEKPTERWYWKRYRYEPTGLLFLDITDYVAGARRHEWSDGKRRQLEEMLPEFIDGLAAAANARKRWKLELAERDRQSKEADLQRQILERQKRAEKERREKLLEQSNSYQQAAAVRKFVADFRAASDKLPPFWTDETRARWIGWAERVADRLDPFHPSRRQGRGQSSSWLDYQSKFCFNRSKQSGTITERDRCSPNL